jgi:hypothetical protein
MVSEPSAIVTQVDVSLELQSLGVSDTEVIRRKLELPNLPIGFNADFPEKHAKVLPHLGNPKFNKISDKRVGLLVDDDVSEALLSEQEWHPFECVCPDRFGQFHVNRRRGPKECFGYLFICHKARSCLKYERYFLYCSTRRKKTKTQEAGTKYTYLPSG